MGANNDDFSKLLFRSLPTHFVKSRLGKLKTRVGKLKKISLLCAKFFPKMFAHRGLKPCRHPWSCGYTGNVCRVLMTADSEHHDGGTSDPASRPARALVQVSAFLRLLWRDAVWLGETGSQM